MMKRAFLAFLAISVFSLSFSACDSFFSNSFGKPREYDLAKINVNAGNIDEWVARSVGNPALAAAVNKKIDSTLKNQPLNAGNAKLLAGRVKLSSQSVGLGASILSHATSALTDIMDGDESAISKVVNGVLSDFNANGGPAAANELAQLLKDCNAINPVIGTVTFNPNYIAVVEPADAADAILLLVMAEIVGVTANVNSGNWENLITNITYFGTSGSGATKKVTVATGASPNQIALAAYLNLLTTSPFSSKADENPITSALKSAIMGIN
ncbi:MAG: hypothetical protein LBI14_06900 [Treponema sp.]|nr:hypothetical protein [Treponema sp.]